MSHSHAFPLAGDDPPSRSARALPPATVRKRLFPTPTAPRGFNAPRPSLSSSSAPGDSSKPFIGTPLPPIPPSSTALSIASSLRRSSHPRPSVASLKGTPSVRRRYVEETPEIWLQRQLDDLKAWLNHELADPSESPSYFSTAEFATSDIFVAKYASVLRFCRNPTFIADVQRLGKRLRDANLSFSPDIALVTEASRFEQFVSLFTFSYNATWLLLGLSVILRTNFAIQIDQILQQTRSTTQKVDIAALQSQLVDHILRTQLVLETPGLTPFTLKSPRVLFVPPSGAAPVKQNGLVLHRALLLILFLDHASRDLDVSSKVRIPLFKSHSSAFKSQEIMDRLSNISMSDPAPLNRFLADRGYRLQYDCPAWNRSTNFIVQDLKTDMQDGVRLCKIASLLTGDPHLLQQVKYSFPQLRTSGTNRDKHSLNVMMALDSIKSYASKRFSAQVNWNASAKDITEGNVSKTVALLWQIVELWIEAKLLNQKMLEEKLMEAQNEFRAKAHDVKWINSPGAFRELSPSVKSPSRLVVYEHSEKDCIHKLLKWCAVVCGIHRIRVVDFTESFRDCVVPCILLNHLHPNAVDMEAVTRVAPAELRDEQESVREFEIVQSNIAQFEKACLRLGAMPNIAISARAALAPPFISELKEESFGRLMILMTAYLFNRTQISRRAKENLEYIQQFAEDWGAFTDVQSPIADDPELAPSEKAISSGDRSARSNALLSPQEDHDPIDVDMPSLSVADVDQSSPLTSQAPSNGGYSPQIVETPLSNQKSMASVEVWHPPDSNSADDDNERKQKASEVIFSNYKAFQARKKTMSDMDSTILLQSAVRGFLARCDHKDLVCSKEEIAKTLEREFLNRKPITPYGIPKATGEMYNMEAEKTEASNSFRLCSKSLEDVGNAMKLLPCHLRKLDEYVQSMLSHEHRLRQTQEDSSTETKLNSEADFSSNSSIAEIYRGPTSATPPTVTVENEESPEIIQKTPTSHCPSPPIQERSPGSESPVYKTPWTTFRPRPGNSFIEGTPSDRFSWHTASPMLRYSNELNHRLYDTTEGVVESPSEDTTTEGISAEPPSVVTMREDISESANISDSGAREVSNDYVHLEHRAHTNEENVPSNRFLTSAVVTFGRAAFEYFLSENQIPEDIIAHAVNNAEVAMQARTGDAARGHDERTSSDGLLRIVDGTSPHIAVVHDVEMSAETESEQTFRSNSDGSNVNGFMGTDGLSSTDSRRNSGDSGDESPLLPETFKNNSETISNLRNDTEGVNSLPRNCIDPAVEISENVAAIANSSNDSECLEEEKSMEALPMERNGDMHSSSSFVFSQRSLIDSMKHVGPESSSSATTDRDPGQNTENHASLESMRADSEIVSHDIEMKMHDESEGPNSDMENIERALENALVRAENAFEIHMERAQERLKFDAERRNAIHMRYKELDQASSLAVKRVEHEEERLEASREMLEEKRRTSEYLFSVDFESDRYTTLLQDDASWESNSFEFDSCSELDDNELDARLQLRNVEDNEVDKDLSKLELDRDAYFRELSTSVESLCGTILTASCFLAELRFTKHMNEIGRRREQQRLASDNERLKLNELILKTMWNSKVALGRVEGDQREIDSAITKLEERLDDTSATVFQLLEADIDSKVMLIEHSEEREANQVKDYLFAHDQAWNKLLETEELIRSYQEISDPGFDDESIGSEDYGVSLPANASSSDYFDGNTASLAYQSSCAAESISKCAMKAKPFESFSDDGADLDGRHSMKSNETNTAFRDMCTSAQTHEESHCDFTDTEHLKQDSSSLTAVKYIAKEASGESISSPKAFSSQVSNFLQFMQSPDTSALMTGKDRMEISDNDGEDENRDPSRSYADNTFSHSSRTKLYSAPRRSMNTVLGSINSPAGPMPNAECTENVEESTKNQESSTSGYESDELPEDGNGLNTRETKNTVERGTNTVGVDNLEDLSVELSAFKINSSKKSVDDVMSNPNSAGKLRALIRRISTATASPVPVHRMSKSSKRNSLMSQSVVCQNIMRTILVVMRHVHRTPTHIRLVDLGMRIIHDFCEVQNRVADLVSIENCVDVLVTCAQFYRDQENILKPAVLILQNISVDSRGLALMMKNRVALRRLEAIDHLLKTAAEQERKNMYRVQYAKMIVEQVRLSRSSQDRHYLLRDHLAAAERCSELPELRIRASHSALKSLLSNLKSTSVL